MEIWIKSQSNILSVSMQMTQTFRNQNTNRKTKRADTQPKKSVYMLSKFRWMVDDLLAKKCDLKRKYFDDLVKMDGIQKKKTRKKNEAEHLWLLIAYKQWAF